MKRPAPALIAEWYARLRATGFRDIEFGRDTNKIDGWTFRGADRHGPETIPLADGFEPQQMLADHPTAVYYRGLAHAGRSLKGRKRKLVLVAANGTAAPGARAIGIERHVGARQVRAFAVSIGLLREAHGS